MAQVFVSYAKKDAPRVQSLVSLLEAHEITVFWDRFIPTGQDWRAYIHQMLLESRCVLVVWSRYSVDSSWVIDEAEEGQRRRILIPVLLDSVQLPMGFRGIQTIDLSQWNFDTSSDVAGRLVRDINAVLATFPASPAIDDAAPAESAISVWIGRKTAFRTIGIALVVVGLTAGYWMLSTRGSPEQPVVAGGAEEGSQSSQRATSTNASNGTARSFDLARFTLLKDFAFSYDGLNLSQNDAATWAERQLQEFPNFDLPKFRELMGYAYSAEGLNLGKRAAGEWAEARLRDSPPFELGRFKDLMAYAYSAQGLNMSKSAAAEWALRKMK